MKKAIALLLIFNMSLIFSAEENILFNKESWELLTYSKIPANKVSFESKKMIINVDSSASPIIYPLQNKGKYKQLSISAKIVGKLNLGNIEQGQKGADDFRLRVGLVYQGDQTLGFFKRQIAADWILKLYSLAPKNTGVSRIEFFNTYSHQQLMGKKRPHPLADVLKENFVLKVDESGWVKQNISIPDDENILAIWLSCDGDGTGSRFVVEINNLQLKG